MSLCVKGRENEIEFCFSEALSLDDVVKAAEEYAKENAEFFWESDIKLSYSGVNLSYNEEIRFEKVLRSLFGNKFIFVKKHRLSNTQIRYSFDKGETVCLVLNKSLRSGEKVVSRGDVLIYGDVNPGATITAKGNITVIGALRGEAHITHKGKVYATYMQPTQIRIGKVISYNKKMEDVASAVAMEENGEIILQCL